MKLKVILGSVDKELNQFKTEEDFNNSPYYVKGWRIVREPSKQIKDIVKDNSKSEDKKETETSLDQLHKTYEQVTGKKVPPRYKGDTEVAREWLNNKINSI